MLQIIDNMIKSEKVLIVSDDKTTQTVDTQQAIETAKEQGSNLLQVAVRKDGVAVCKIVNLEKELYKIKKKNKNLEKSKRNNNMQLKEIVFRLGTQPRDMEIKLRQVSKWLNAKKNIRVRLTVQLKGRERAYLALAKKRLEDALMIVDDIAKPDGTFIETERGIQINLIRKER